LSAGGHRQLGGLDKLKPFITEMYDWESLPPNPGNFFYNMFADLRIVLTEPEPGKITIFESKLYAEDSMGPQRKIEYRYDVVTGRVTRFGGYDYDYEDSAGYLVRIRQKSSRQIDAVWKLQRDSTGTIIGVDHLTMGMRRDSLRLRTRYQIIKWGPDRATNSARSAPSFGESFYRFPWLPEGGPIEWIASRRGLEGMNPGKHVQRVFDSSSRLIRESDEEYDVRVEYDASGPIKLKQYITRGKPEGEIRLIHRTKSGDLVWQDDLEVKMGNSKFGHSIRRLKY
jgi:hypothetical protein